MTLEELREQFKNVGGEKTLEKNDNNYYIDDRVHTLWQGYKMCAKENKILPESCDI